MAESLEQHYRRLLGLEEPWVVEAVNLGLAAQRVEIRLRAQLTTRGVNVRNVENGLSFTTTRLNGDGGTWTPCSLRRF